MKCVVLFKKDVVWFKKEAARENRPLWRRASEASGVGREEWPFILGKFCKRNTVCRGKLWAIKRGER